MWRCFPSMWMLTQLPGWQRCGRRFGALDGTCSSCSQVLRHYLLLCAQVHNCIGLHIAGRTIEDLTAILNCFRQTFAQSHQIRTTTMDRIVLSAQYMSATCRPAGGAATVRGAAAPGGRCAGGGRGRGAAAAGPRAAVPDSRLGRPGSGCAEKPCNELCLHNLA